jgi:predicted ATPase/DNA-binding SARP family transcriptional activator
MVNVTSGRQRAVLAMLLCSDQPVPRDRLIDELWGERPPPTAAKALSVFLSRLRSQLGDVIAREPDGYRISPGLEFELDASLFRHLVAEARAEPSGRRALLAEALALFRGDPLTGIECDGAVARWRRELQQERLEAFVARIDCDLEDGGGPELVVEIESLLDDNPYEERIWGQLIVALARSGRQADALEAYQRVRRLFAYELGIEPGEPLARIQAAILAGGDGWNRGSSAAGSVTGLGSSDDHQRGSGVPRPLSALIGRRGELSELLALLADPDLRLLTLVGGGGVGKTRLALELAHRLEGSFEDGAAFVDLGQLNDPELVTTEIAAALGARDGAPPPPVDRLGHTLGSRELLLVLDNFEHLLPAAAAVAELLESAPGVRAIATSRTPLRIRGEQLFEVEPLDVPDADDEAGLLGACPAAELFLERGRAIDRRLQSDPDSIRLIAAICRRLDGLPLGIELAAAQLRVLTLAQLERSLEQPLSLGGPGPRDLPDRQRTLELTIRWSFDLLSPDARDLLLATGVFRGGFTLEALAAVAGRSPQLELGELLDSSLVRRERDGHRFATLELVRAFVRSELEGGARHVRLRARHRAYFAGVADAVGAELHDGDPRGELADQLQPEHANLRAALEDAFAADDRDSALGLVRGMRALWYTGWLVHEGQGLIDRVLTQFDVDPSSELLLLRSASFLEGVAADSATHGAWTERLALRAEQIGDLPALSIAVANLTALAHNAQDRAAVAKLKPRLVDLTDADIPPRHRAFVHYALAASLYLEGDISGACEYAGVGAALAAEADHAYLMGATSLLHVMMCSLRDGVMRRSDLAEAVETTRRAPITPLAPFALWLVARYAVSLDREASIGWLAEAERIYRGLDAEMWPESDVRDAAMRALGIDSIPPADSAVTDYLETLAAAAQWLEDRDPDEISPL